jgi:hypothetical protein
VLARAVTAGLPRSVGSRLRSFGEKGFPSLGKPCFREILALSAYRRAAQFPRPIGLREFDSSLFPLSGFPSFGFPCLWDSDLSRFRCFVLPVYQAHRLTQGLGRFCGFLVFLISRFLDNLPPNELTFEERWLVAESGIA